MCLWENKDVKKPSNMTFEALCLLSSTAQTSTFLLEEMSRIDIISTHTNGIAVIRRSVPPVLSISPRGVVNHAISIPRVKIPLASV